jgi:hypothetical protein
MPERVLALGHFSLCLEHQDECAASGKVCEPSQELFDSI